MSNIETPHHFVPLSLIAALRERYEVVRETGSGGSATVYLARDLKHQRLVALKVLNPDVGQVGGARFLREIQVSAAMQHPHILPMYDSGVADGRLYLVMPFVDGGSLRQRLEGQPQLPVAEAVRIAHDIAVALSFAHAQGVVHRDVKPENIMFYHGQACLADFGIARVVEALDSRVTAHDTVVGTPAYMSPEQMAHGGFDARSDVYSLAVVLYEMISGGPAHSGTTPAELLRQRLKERPDPVHQKRGGIPSSLDALLARALSPSPNERFEGAAELADALEAVQRELSGTRRLRSGAAGKGTRRPTTRWIVAAAVLVLVSATFALASLGGGAWGRHAPVFGRGDALAEGHKALARWNLDQAEKAFSAAAATQPDSPPARLWLAQTFVLERRADSEQFRLTASRLGTFAGLLHGRDSLLAAGLIAIAARDFPRACEAYERLRRADSLDALAWYGLGDCYYLDDAVIRDAHSPSGWRFRTSWPAAARAYMRAVEIEPASHRAVPYALLTVLLPTDPSFVRAGRSLEGKLAFDAYPSIAGDSTVHVPWPAAEFGAGAPQTLSSSMQIVLQRDRERLLAFARTWVAAAPQSADAYEALALAREAREELGADSSGAAAALSQARKFSRSPIQQVRLAAFAVRIALKTGDFDRARDVTDSLLREWSGRRDLSAPIAHRLSGLAALTGRIGEAARLMAVWTAEPNADLGIAPALTNVSARLFMRAAAGVCDDSLTVLRRQADALLESYTSPVVRDSIRAALLGRTASLEFPCLGGRALEALPATTPLDRAQRAYAAHDRRHVRAIFDSLRAIRRFYKPGDVSLDFTVQESWLLFALGDTAGAHRSLQLVLDALPTLGSMAVYEEGQAAAVARAFTLEAELEAASGDRAAAQRRAANALALLQHSDPALAPNVARLRALRNAAQ